MLYRDSCFEYQTSCEHCDIEDDCGCSRTALFYTKLAGSVVKSMIIAVAARIVCCCSGVAFFKYQTS